MNVLILGAGRIGSTLAQHLVDLEHHVTVIDRDEARLNELSNRLDVQPVLGGASYPDVLERAGAQDADLLIATTDNDEVNMIACEMAHSLFDIETKIARIRGQNYLNDKYRMTIFQPKYISIDHIVTPEIEIARAISNNLQVMGATNVVDVLVAFKFLTVVCPQEAPLAHTPLRLLQGLYPSLTLAFVALGREGRTFLPNVNDVILPDDIVYFVVPSSQIRDVMVAFGFPSAETPQVTLAGYGMVGETFAQELMNIRPDLPLQICELDPHRAEAASQRFPKAQVFCGDVMDATLLQETHIARCDAFIAMTDDDNVNVLSSLLAKNCGARRAVTLLSATQNASFVASLGIDNVIDPNAITVSAVLRAVRQHKMRSLCLFGDGIELLEIHVDEESPLMGLSLDDLSFAGQTTVVILKHQNRQASVAPTRDVVESHDILVMAVTKDAMRKIEKLVSERASYR